MVFRLPSAPAACILTFSIICSIPAALPCGASIRVSEDDIFCPVMLISVSLFLRDDLITVPRKQPFSVHHQKLSTRVSTTGRKTNLHRVFAMQTITLSSAKHTDSTISTVMSGGMYTFKCVTVPSSVLNRHLQVPEGQVTPWESVLCGQLSQNMYSSSSQNWQQSAPSKPTSLQHRNASPMKVVSAEVKLLSTWGNQLGTK
mmetsp:Transcript_23991/g.44082  ORF Transcript_23991/g.44082 Transcript_23991/m.44082 type:complete len:201 (+) Transcript_23991:802-1404(+)